MDRFGNHAASCATGRHRIRRHDYLKGIISELLHDANIRHKVEATKITDDNTRPGDIFIYNFGRTGLAIDVGITDPVTKFSSSKSGFDSICKGYYANEYYEGKLKHFDECKLSYGYEDIDFSPIIFENFGFIDPRSRKVLDDIIKMASENMGKHTSKIKSYIYTKIGISLARSDAQAGGARYYYNFGYKYYDK